MNPRHFLSLMDLSVRELKSIIGRAIALKAMRGQSDHPRFMYGKTAVLVFEKSSTRTRVSFATGIGHFGGNCIFLEPGESQLGRGESIADTARVLSRMADLIIIRTGPHARIQTMAEHASVPVINALSDFSHPCQLLADLQAYQEHRGDIRGKKVAWIGDGNNVCHSWMNAARLLDFELHIATPANHAPDAGLCRQCAGHIVLGQDPAAAATDSALVITDTWSGMGFEKEKAARESVFKDYQVNRSIMACAAKDAIFMHCLPAYRGSEVTAEVIDGPQSVVWDEAENRLHAQKALMEFLSGRHPAQGNSY